MCRIAVAIGDAKELKKIAVALASASKRDPYKAARGKGWSHRDGWGYVLITGDEVRHYRTTKAIADDIRGLDELLSSINSDGVLVMHSRAASQGGVRLTNTQPFEITSRGGEIGWLIHNGDIMRNELAEMLTRRPSDEEMRKTSDSHLLAVYVREQMEMKGADEETVMKAMKKVIPPVKSSLNTAIILSDGEKLKAIVTAYSRPEYIEDPKNWDYVRIIRLKESKIMAVGSSTLELYHDGPWETLENGTVLSIEVNLKEMKIKDLKIRNLL